MRWKGRAAKSGKLQKGWDGKREGRTGQRVFVQKDTRKDQSENNKNKQMKKNKRMRRR